MEDKDCFSNLPLIYTLRQEKDLNTRAYQTTTNDGERPKKYTEAYPPKFFLEDMEKWEKKFESANKERDRYKKVVFISSQPSAQTQNTNVYGYDLNTLGKKKPDEANVSESVKQMNKSIHTKVLQRRKSRQSCNMFCNIDFEYAGNSNQVNHLIV